MDNRAQYTLILELRRTSVRTRSGARNCGGLRMRERTSAHPAYALTVVSFVKPLGRLPQITVRSSLAELAVSSPARLVDRVEQH